MENSRLHVARKRQRQVFMKKLILGFAGCALVLALSVILSNGFVDAHGNSTESPVRHKYYKSIEIASGDTLWDIAKEYMNEDYDSIYAYIDELKYINGLTSDGIQEGNRFACRLYSLFITVYRS